MALEELEVPRKATPSQQVFANAELFSQILGNAVIYTQARTLKWKSQLVPLALVNRSFFHATVDVVWASMDFVAPFFAILQPSKKDNMLVFPNGIEPAQWERFRLYSSRVKWLILNGPSAVTLDAASILYMSTCRDELAPLFPKVRQLQISSMDQTTLFVALNCIGPCLASVTISVLKPALNPILKEGYSAITACLSRRAKSLDMVSLAVVDADAISNISRIPSLRLLKLNLDNVASWNLLEGLTVQHLEVTLPVMQFSTIVNIDENSMTNYLNSKTSSTVRSLKVSADARSQYRLAMRAGPQYLNGLTLDILSADSNTDTGLHTPFTLAMHIGRNSNLTSLYIATRPTASTTPTAGNLFVPKPEEFDRIGNRGIQLFLKYLGSLHNITSLYIKHVAFPSPDIYFQIFDSLKEMRQLTTLHLHPSLLVKAGAPQEYPRYPDLAFLESFAIGHPQLVELLIVLSLEGSSYSRSFTPTKRKSLLKNLYIVPPSYTPQFSLDNLLWLSKHLDELFPRLETLTRAFMQNPHDVNLGHLWKPVEQLVRSRQELRARVIWELGNREQMPNLMAT
ncbi:hypothetical protein DFP72DRAFT_1126974 [Ephemerocybe angulata]|uniref:Uncharacterized protein n=1 Tax=Ephemerocybe angulata TaxID=980116 RepID=A0A8H6HX18_9AGAR|nr:hypothetical protein DFP72DRAFT_1126974 [Tulosesus angulatus]